LRAGNESAPDKTNVRQATLPHSQTRPYFWVTFPLAKTDKKFYILFPKRKIFRQTMSKLDKIDLRIIDLLMEDGRMTSVEIARRLGDVSERAVRYRVERLLKEEIVRIGAIPNPRAVGYNVVADVWLEVESDAILEVARKVAEFDAVSYVACAIGEQDVSIQVVGKDTAEVYKFVTEVIGKTPGVRKTTTSIVPIVIKDVYQWHIPPAMGEDAA
jgi:Lrp/AsnC family transcriptional regulator, regulator for asnA, asnC and gidA